MEVDIILIDDPKYSTQPYLDVAYVRAVLKQIGVDTNVHFVLPSRIEEMTTRLFENREPKIILGSFANTEADNMMKTLEIIKTLFPQVVICVASSLANRYSKQIMEEFSFVDIVVKGEPDETCKELCQRFQNKTSISDCLGITYRDHETGGIIENANRPYIKDLDSLPYPDRSHQREAGFKLEYVNIKKNRGCTGTCTFCKDNAYRGKQPGSYFRMRSVKNTVDEIEMLYHKNKERVFKFFMGDYCFLDGGKAGMEQAAEFFDEIVRRNLRLVMHFQTRAELINDESIFVLQKAKKAGVATILIGLESANDSELKLYGKKATLNDNNNAIKILKEQNIVLIPSFISFNHFSTYETVKNNIEYIHKNEFSHNFGWFRTYLEVHPETSYIDILVKKGLLSENYHYLRARENARWVNTDMQELCTAFQKVEVNPQLQRNDFRIARIINVVTNRLAPEHQELFKALITSYHEMCHEMRNKNYAMAMQCLEMSFAREDISKIEKICCKYDISKYYKPFEDLKMQMEIRLERTRKYLL